MDRQLSPPSRVDGPLPAPAAGGSTWIKPLVFVIGAAALTAACIYFRHDLTLEALAREEARLFAYRDAHPLLLALIVSGVCVVGVACSLPVVITLSVLSGLLFGLWEGVALMSFASSLGAILAFWISRYLLRDAISHRFAHLMTEVDELLERDGALYVLSLRLIHVIPFWLINLLMGWTTIRVKTFWWATQLGTLPGDLRLRQPRGESEFYRL